MSDPRAVEVAAGGLRLRVLVWGRDADPAVLLVHGNGAHARWWAPLVPALVPGWRVLAPDLRGHGASDWPAAPAYRIHDFDADLAAVAAALAPDGPLALVGHSMGGRIALWYAAHRPARVRALGMLDARLDPVVPARAARHRRLAPGTRTGRAYPSRAAALAAFRFVPDEPDVPPAVVALLAEHAVVERDGGWTFRFDRGVLGTAGDAAGDLRRLLPRVACPTFVASGRTSWVLDAAARTAIVAALARGEGHEFPGGHHFLLVDAAAVGARLRRFLDAC